MTDINNTGGDLSAQNESRGVEPEQTTETEIIKYEDNSPLGVAPVLNSSNVPSSLVGHRDDMDHSIQSFLRRERNVFNTNWSTLENQGDLLFVIDFPQAVFSSQVNVCKCENLRYFRCDIRIRIKQNCTKFCCGTLLFWIDPVPSLRGDILTGYNLTSMTGYHHALMDAASNQEVEFVIPFWFVRPYWDLINDQAIPWFTLRCNVLNALNGISVNDISRLSVFVSCLNIELSTPTFNEFSPLPHISTASNGRRGIAQMESKAMAKDNNTAVLKNVGKVIRGVLEGNSEYAAQDGPASIAFEVLEGLSGFGFSNPPVATAPIDITQYPAKHHTAGYRTTDAVTLATHPFNHVDLAHFGPTKTDELDISHVIGRYNFIETIPWQMSDITGHVLRTWPVTPGFSGDGSATQVRPTQLAYVAAMFEKWVGSIDYKLNVAATQFHTGRLCLIFMSGVFSAPAVFDPEDIDMFPRVVFDIQTSKVVTYSVPYSVNYPFLRVRVGSRGGDPGLDYTQLLDPLVSQGILALVVLNPLGGPENSIASTVAVNLWVKGGNDMQFAIPSFPTYVPVPYEPPANLVEASRPFSKVVNRGVAQMLASMPPGLNSTRGGDIPTHQSLQQSSAFQSVIKKEKHFVGETVRNLRVLCHRLTPYAEITPTPTGGVRVDPAEFSFTDTTTYHTPLDRVSHLYVAYRGGMEYMIVPQNITGIPYPMWNAFLNMTDNTAVTPPTGVTPTVHGEIGFNQVISQNNTPFVRIHTPFYQTDGVFSVITNTDAPSRPRLRVEKNGFSASSPLDVYKAGDDSLTFYYLIGPPNLQLYA